MTKVLEYVVYEGMSNPRDPKYVGWREWARFGPTELRKAVSEAKRHRIARIETVRDVMYFRQGRKVPDADLLKEFDNGSKEQVGTV